jgi:hypothetical protein
MFAMKVKFTYKEATLLAGIVVAILIMLTLWLQPVSAESGEVSRKRVVPAAKPASKVIVEKVILVIRQKLQ